MSNMMSREFTRREKILLLIMCVLLIGILYFQFVYKPARESIKKYDTAKLETQLLTEQTKASSIKKMNREMASNKAGNAGVVASYNNVKNEIKALNDIFAGARTFNMEFSPATKDGDAVRRNIDISFTAGSYNAAENILKKLYNCKYRCLIRTINITSTGSGVQSGAVTGTLKVTFFETLYNADTKDGLTEESQDTTGTGTAAAAS
jgi:cell division protein FtsL